jgi:hypothetical protein
MVLENTVATIDVVVDWSTPRFGIEIAIEAATEAA